MSKDGQSKGAPAKHTCTAMDARPVIKMTPVMTMQLHPDTEDRGRNPGNMTPVRPTPQPTQPTQPTEKPPK
jgi:hypothetical protein